MTSRQSVRARTNAEGHFSPLSELRASILFSSCPTQPLGPGHKDKAPQSLTFSIAIRLFNFSSLLHGFSPFHKSSALPTSKSSPWPTVEFGSGPRLSTGSPNCCTTYDAETDAYNPAINGSKISVSSTNVCVSGRGQEGGSTKKKAKRLDKKKATDLPSHRPSKNASLRLGHQGRNCQLDQSTHPRHTKIKHE